jgi:hypothetical protein
VNLALTIPDQLLTEVEERIAAKLRLELSQPVGYLNVTSAADFLDTTPGAIRSLVKRKELAPIRTPNGRLLFTVESLREWAEGGTP